MSLLNKWKIKKTPVETATAPAVPAPERVDVPHPVRLGSESGAILRQAVISEKSAIGESQGVYTFIVANDANKASIAAAIKTRYGVRPLRVRIVNRGGKFVTRGRISGRQSDTKRALVTLAKGQALTLHEGV